MQERRLAAIMFTDIVGYTSLMGSDEDCAFKVLRKNREIHKKFIEQFNGTLIKEMGDGMLISFDLASEAVRCAIEIQKACKPALHAGTLQTDDTIGIPLKIGIHEGEMVFEGNDVLGDGVNIASRIQDGAAEGDILISVTVYRDIKNKADIHAELVGQQSFKNVEDPISIYHIIYGSEVAITYPKVKITSDHKSIAVLPFVNMSNDQEQEYFCDGMSEEIINALTHVEELKVIARTSAFEFKNKNLDIRKIGNQLNVSHLLEGSVRKAGNRLRITAQLIQVSDGSHLWSERYDREIQDVFEIQDEISLAIVNNLKIRLIEKEKLGVLKNATSNVEAYNLYLLGMFEWYKRSEESMMKSIDYFKEALKNDPDYTIAYCGIANAYASLVDWGCSPTESTLNEARAMLNKAIEIDPDVSEIYAAFVYVNICEWDIKQTRENFGRAVALNPKSAVSYHLFALQNATLGNFDDALSLNATAREIDPLSMIFNFACGIILYFSENYEKALKQFHKTLLINESFMPAILWATYCHVLMDNHYEATKQYRKILVQYDESNRLIEDSENAFKAGGIIGFLEWLIKVGLKYYQRKHNLHYHKAICHSFLGQFDQAFKCLEKGYVQKTVRTTFIKHEPGLNKLKEDPRFNDLIKKIGFWS